MYFFPKKQAEKCAENAYLYSCIQSISLLAELSIERRRLVFEFYTYMNLFIFLSPAEYSSIISYVVWPEYCMLCLVPVS